MDGWAAGIKAGRKVGRSIRYIVWPRSWRLASGLFWEIIACTFERELSRAERLVTASATLLRSELLCGP